jgi:hypothetical protein
MAVASEHEGNLDMALIWAKKAYEIGGKSAAATYINILNSRIMDNNRLNEQMKGK